MDLRLNWNTHSSTCTTEIKEGVRKLRLGSLYPMEGWDLQMDSVKNVKDAYPVQLSEYAVQNRISEQPDFVLWIKYVMKKRDHIVSKNGKQILAEDT